MNNRGAVLIICCMVIMVLILLGAAVFERSVSEKSFASKYYYSTQALWLAEAGIQRALWELGHNNCAGCSVCGSDRCVSDTRTFNSLSGSYSATIHSGNTVITSTGSFPDTNTIQKTIQASTTFKSVFQYAIFSRDTITFANSALTDSYDSSKGEYNVLLPDGTSNVYKNGDVGTDSAATPAITLTNSAKINGDAGVGGVPATGIQASSAAITGSRNGGVSIDFPSSIPVPTPPAGSWTSCTSCNLSQSNTGSLSSGSYSAAAFTLNNNAQLSIDGDVTLYVTGDFNLNNSSQFKINPGGRLTLYVNGTFNVGNSATLNNSTKIPSNFTLYSRYSQASGGVNFANSGSLYGTVFAPQTHIDISNSFEIYGALVANSTSLFNSAKVHYDEALKNLPTPFTTPTYSIQDWCERQSNDNSKSPF